MYSSQIANMLKHMSLEDQRAYRAKLDLETLKEIDKKVTSGTTILATHTNTWIGNKGFRNYR